MGRSNGHSKEKGRCLGCEWIDFMAVSRSLLSTFSLSLLHSLSLFVDGSPLCSLLTPCRLIPTVKECSSTTGGPSIPALLKLKCGRRRKLNCRSSSSSNNNNSSNNNSSSSRSRSRMTMRRMSVTC